jgi:hypothetical protein
MNTIDTDTADTDVLRQQISELRDRAEREARSLSRSNSDLHTAVRLLTDLSDGNEDELRDLCDDNEDYENLVLKYEIIDLTTDYEIRINVPVTMTILVSGTSEDDARENVGEFLSNQVTVDVNGAEDYDFDSYDYDIHNICKA